MRGVNNESGVSGQTTEKMIWHLQKEKGRSEEEKQEYSLGMFEMHDQ